jgi:hypothetical protein
MTHRIMHFIAYDSFEEVHWALTIQDEDLPKDHPDKEAKVSGVLLSQGHPLWTHWLRELLEDARESL